MNIEKEKIELFVRLKYLEKQGYNCSVSFNDSYEKIRFEYESILRKMEENHEKQMSKERISKEIIAADLVFDGYKNLNNKLYEPSNN